MRTRKPTEKEIREFAIGIGSRYPTKPSKPVFMKDIPKILKDRRPGRNLLFVKKLTAQLTGRLYPGLPYVPGEIVEEECANPDRTVQCGSGLHVYALGYWSGEEPLHGLVAVKKRDVIFMDRAEPKVRVKRLLVLRISGTPWTLDQIKDHYVVE